MSIDNSILICKDSKGYRVTTCQAWENVYWWPVCCDNPRIKLVEDALYVWEECKNCKTDNPSYAKRDKPHPQTVEIYFQGCKYFKTEEEMLEEVSRLYDREIKEYGLVEEGIHEINLEE